MKVWIFAGSAASLLLQVGVFINNKLGYQSVQATATTPEMQTAIVRSGDLVLYASGTDT